MVQRSKHSYGAHYLLGNGSLFDCQNDAVFSLNADNGASSANRLHGVFDLQQVPIRTEHCNGTIVGHAV